MSDFFVMLVLKTVIYYSKLLGFQNFACLKLAHYESDTDFMDKHYIVQSSKVIPLILLKWSVLFVTIVKLCVTDVTPIKRSKSSIGFPTFLNRDFSFA